ncbi:uncharacterized protein IUM83_17047 [Phytophthora cinnamomi]|uniref:uncharacterized protein n=1 Tax=Phytophthora cinnamomi TaxID=4785 RepID=UPI00355ABFD3|nr:hypothetical protein IUM83_17047 [Phytophthora cinnamomi]
MGGTDSVVYCQATDQEMFDEFLYRGLLIGLDDLLGYHKTEVGLLTLLEKVLEICAQKGLKLNPKKCKLFAKEVVWCGRVVSAGGVKQDPRRVQALVDLPSPTTGQELQQFLCALNWMRTAIPDYNKLVQPLMDLMEHVYTKAGARTRRSVTRVVLSDAG